MLPVEPDDVISVRVFARKDDYQSVFINEKRRRVSDGKIWDERKKN